MAATPASARRTKARRRTSKREAPPVHASTFGRLWPRVSFALWATATLVLLVLTASALEQRITWYLAVDQYGYLSFAHDLLRGKVFHHWRPIDALAPYLPTKVDVLSQTYIFDHGRLYCRYSPGFPMVLAGWLMVFGDDGAHYLNPTIFIGLLLLMLGFQRRAFRSGWRATAGIALIVLCPSTLHLWALTLVRDLCAHFMGLLGVFLLLPVAGRPLRERRTAAAGLAIGFAATVRPDAVLYALPAFLLLIARWRREHAGRRVVLRGAGAAVLAMLVGLAPFLAFNWVATGNPFQPTQGMEFRNFFATNSPPATGGPAIGYASTPWRGGTTSNVQGGSLRLDNVPRVLPGNLALIRRAYGDALLAIGLWGAVVALLHRRLLFLATVPYVVLGLLFFSFWSKPDERYLSGIFLIMPVLVVEGLFGSLDLARIAWRRRGPQLARGVALAIVLAFAVCALTAERSTLLGALPTLTLLVPALGAVALLVAALFPARRVATVAASAVALALLGILAFRTIESSAHRARFQKEEMLVARETFASVVEPDGVVISSEEVGRPAENIDYYSGVAHALYMTDLQRWHLSVPRVSEIFLEAGLKPYLFLPAADPVLSAVLDELVKRFEVKMVAQVPPEEAIDYFVAAAFHRGVEMHLYRIAPLADAARRP